MGKQIASEGRLKVTHKNDKITIEEYVPNVNVHECTAREGNRCDVCFALIEGHEHKTE